MRKLWDWREEELYRLTKVVSIIGLRYTTVWNSAMLQSTDVATAMKAGMEKKNPRFEKL